MPDIGRLFARDLQLSDERRTLLRALLDERGLAGSPAAPTPDDAIAAAGPGRIYAPLSFAQERLWFLHQLDPGSVAYNVALRVTLRGVLDVAALRRALDDLVRRHETLRTTIELEPVDDQPKQRIHPPCPVPLDVQDVAGLSTDEADRLVREPAVTPFDLTRGPLLRCRLLRHDAHRHTLVLVIHHVIVDAWSMGVIVGELARLYDHHRGGAPGLPEPTHQYADYAVWQRNLLAGPRLGEQLAYWRQRLADLPVLDLPTDHPRPPVTTTAGAQLVFQYSVDLRNGLDELCRAHGVTMFMALLAAFASVLSRHTGQQDIVVGTPIAGRGRPELDNLVGFFVNTLVLRADLSGRPTFRDVLRRIRETAVGAYGHQDVPFERLVDELQPDRSLDRTPLFQVMFGMQTAPVSTVELPGLEIAADSVDTDSSMFDLLLTFDDRPDGLAGLLTYRTDLFRAERIGQLIRHLGRLLEAVVADPGIEVGAVDLLDDSERDALLALAAGPERPRQPEGLHELFERQVRRSPAAAAVRAGDRELTYAELDQLAERMAARLRALGVPPEGRVGLAVDRSLELVVGLIATMKAGGCAVPLDLSYPVERLGWIVRDAELDAVLIDDAGHAALPALPTDLPVVTVADQGPVTDPRRDDGRPPAVQPDRLGYLIYTSGSTGHPKGVMVRQAALVNHMRWMQETFPLDGTDRVLQKTAVGFDASVWEFWAPLTAGACLVMSRPGGERDIEYLVRTLNDERITVLQVVPGLLDVLLDEPDFVHCARLRRVYCGGEALPAAVADRFHGSVPAELVNLYGPAETCIDALTWISDPAAAPGATVPIGAPIANVRAYVLDGRMNLVPVGVVGELYLGGDGLGRGYLNRPDLTAAAFVPDPFTRERPGGLLYRTGDLVRRRRNGEIEYVGRRDQQLKVRGHRIETAEVEAALGRHPAVRRAAVAMVSDEGGPRLVAYVVPLTGASVTLADLRDHLRPLLPEPMHPAGLVLLDALPQGPNGKLDRAALPRPPAEVPAPGRAPRTALERLLCEQYGAVLGRQRIDPERSFFDLGGNSLQAMRLISRLRAVLGEAIPVSTLFQAPSPAGLAARLADGGSRAAARLPHGSRRPGDAVPLSFAQRRMWFLQQIDKGRSDYNVALVARLRGDVDSSALQAAFVALAARHEVLRTRFLSTGSSVRGVIDEAIDVPFAVEQPADPETATAQILAEPFDLSAGPIWRARLLRVGTLDYLLVVAVHHVATDGLSTSLLVRDLAELYTAGQQGRQPALRPLPVSHADFAAWQQRWLAGPEAAAQLAYWRQQLTGLRRLRIGRSGAPASTADRPGASLPVEIGPQLRARLAAAARTAGATLFQTVLAGFDVLLAQETGETDLAVGTDVTSRPLAELEEVVGPFINQVVLRTELADQPTFRDLMTRVRRTCEAAQAHQDVPFEEVVAAVNPQRAAFADPLVDVKLIFSDAVRPPRFGDLVVEDVDVPVRTVKHDVDFFLLDDGVRITGALHYATDALDRPAVTALRDHFLALLAACAADPDRRIHELPTRREEDGVTAGDEPNDRPRPSFRSIRPRRMRAEADRLVTVTMDRQNARFPLTVRTEVDDLDAAAWVADHRSRIDDWLVEAGAVMFRGFGVDGPAAFERTARALCHQLNEENGEHTPAVAGSPVQVPVFYPPERELLWHNENSFNDRWPSRIIFCCQAVPDRGGESTLVDSRQVYQRLAPALRERFERHGVRYQRNFGAGVGLRWEQVYGTEDRAVVEQRCRATGVRCEWQAGNRLRTTAVRPATVRHPRSGAWSWFNQAQHWHTACLDPQARASLLSMFDEPDLPRSCTYGDGTPIEDEVMMEIVDVYRSLAVTVPWQAGDFMLVDNVLTAHGRTPFSGNRKVLVALGDEQRFDTATDADGTTCSVRTPV